MNQLSIRANNFLINQERFSSTVNREEIIESFIANNAPVFEPLIEFQQKYSGYKFLAGLAPIHFGLLQGDGGYPVRSGTAIIDFSLSETDLAKYQFVCATTSYQMEFTLDEYGRYYEDYEIIASTFDKAIEHLSIWDELKKIEGIEILIQDQQVDINNLDRKLGLTIIPEASDEYTQWYNNDLTYMTQWKGRTTIFASENLDKLKALLNL